MSPAARIGLFMLVGMIILGIFIIKIEDIPVGERGERLTVTARFESVAGLDKQAAVRIAGVRVGKVEEISLDGAQAVLHLSLNPSVRLHEGASAHVTSLGMLGDKYIEILPGDPRRPILPAGSELHGGTAPSFDDVMKIATDIGADIKEVSEALRGSVGGTEGARNVDEIVTNMRDLTATLRVLIAENQANVNETTANFRDFSETLRVELPRIADKMNLLADQLGDVVGENQEDLQASMSNIRELTDRLQESADNLNQITDKIASGEGSLGKLVNDETTVDNLNETLDSIEGGIDTLNESMGRYRRFNLEIGLRAEALANTNKSRFAFGIDLWTTDKRFFRVEGVDMPYGDISTRTDYVDIEFDDGTTGGYTETKVTSENRLGLNVQVGYKIFPNTVVRAGLIETTGGVGIDHAIKLWNRPLVFVFEAYDFARPFDESAHLKFEGRYFVSPHIFLTAGWDDPLVSQRSSVVLGGGISWNDEDVKYSLGLASTALR